MPLSAYSYLSVAMINQANHVKNSQKGFNRKIFVFKVSTSLRVSA